MLSWTLGEITHVKPLAQSLSPNQSLIHFLYWWYYYSTKYLYDIGIIIAPIYYIKGLWHRLHGIEEEFK